MHWTILRKLQALSLTIVALFTLALLVIQAFSGQIAEGFEKFYRNGYQASSQFERIKEVQVDSMVNIRGLQISYLLNLTDQTRGYLDVIAANRDKTPRLLSEIDSSFAGDPERLNELNLLVKDFQAKAETFVAAMQNAADHKAPFPVFKAFMDSYTKLVGFFDRFKQLVDTVANDTEQDINDAIDMAGYVFYIGLLVALVTSLGLSHLIARGISNGVKEVRDAALRLSEGKLNTVSKVTERDEIYDLSESINNTIVRLRETIQGIQGASLLVADNSDEVLTYNNQVRMASDGVTDNTNVIAAAVEEMSLTSQNIAQNITQTATAAGEIHELTGESLAASQKSVEEIHVLLDSLIDTAQTVSNLKIETGNIEKILEVIRGISEQTNLLALNAAIEAARAGEQGRGFAVVADEVRGLAQRSQNSVNEIEGMLSSLIAAGDRAAEQMNASSDIARSLNERVDESNRLTQEIRFKVTEVNNQSHEIATAAEEQSAVVLDISNNMHEVKSLVEQNGAIVAVSNQKSEEMKEASRQVSDKLRYFSI